MNLFLITWIAWSKWAVLLADLVLYPYQYCIYTSIYLIIYLCKILNNFLNLTLWIHRRVVAYTIRWNIKKYFYSIIKYFFEIKNHEHKPAFSWSPFTWQCLIVVSNVPQNVAIRLLLVRLVMWPDVIQVIGHSVLRRLTWIHYPDPVPPLYRPLQTGLFFYYITILNYCTVMTWLSIVNLPNYPLYVYIYIYICISWD